MFTKGFVPIEGEMALLGLSGGDGWWKAKERGREVLGSDC